MPHLQRPLLPSQVSIAGVQPEVACGAWLEGRLAVERPWQHLLVVVPPSITHAQSHLHITAEVVGTLSSKVGCSCTCGSDEVADECSTSVRQLITTVAPEKSEQLSVLFVILTVLKLLKVPPYRSFGARADFAAGLHCNSVEPRRHLACLQWQHHSRIWACSVLFFVLL